MNPSDFQQTQPDGLMRQAHDIVHAEPLHEAHAVFLHEICGMAIETSSGAYVDAHHVQPLGGEHAGPDIVENVLCVAQTITLR